MRELVELLSADDIFDRVHELAGQVPGGVASPGLGLAGQYDDDASFATALAGAIRRLTGLPGYAGPRSGGDNPVAALVRAPPPTATLATDGELALRQQAVMDEEGEVGRAIADLAGGRGLLGLAQSAAVAQVTSAGRALAAFRTQVTDLLAPGLPRGADAPRSPRRVSGCRPIATPPLPPNEVSAFPPATDPGQQPERKPLPPVPAAVADAIRDGASLPQAVGYLEEAAALLDRAGRLPDPAQDCPDDLIGGLVSPAPPHAQGLVAVGRGRGTGGARLGAQPGEHGGGRRGGRARLRAGHRQPRPRHGGHGWRRGAASCRWPTRSRPRTSWSAW